MKRFRANFIVQSQKYTKPLEELQWSRITIGNFQFQVIICESIRNRVRFRSDQLVEFRLQALAVVVI